MCELLRVILGDSKIVGARTRGYYHPFYRYTSLLYKAEEMSVEEHENRPFKRLLWLVTVQRLVLTFKKYSQF